MLVSKAIKKPCRISCADVQIDLKKCTIVDHFYIPTVDFPENSIATNPLSPVWTANKSVQKQRVQGGDAKGKHTELKTPKINWKNPENYRFLKMVVEVSLCGEKGQRTLLTDRTVLDSTLRIIVHTLSGILRKGLRFEDITVGMVYPT